MRPSRLLTTLILSLATAAIAQTTQPAVIPIKRIVLYSSGVGYFQHSGTVHDNATSLLQFKTDQINDVLKSLVLQDADQGTISSVNYPSLDPLGKTLASFRINIADNPSLSDLINQLRGSRVSLDLGTEHLSGTILGVEKKPRPTKDDEKKVIELPVLNLLSSTSIRSIDFEQIHSVQFEDKELQSELEQALAALAQSRDKDKKPVEISFAGHGDRHVSIGYVVETPVWKTSYRLVLPADPKDKAQLQGWAIVENQTDSDWDHIQLSLVSGRPISFIQNLYQPLYIPRPTIQPELYSSLVPQEYAEGQIFKTEAKARRAAMDRPAPGAPAAFGGAAADSISFRGEEEKLSVSNSSIVSAAASAAKLGELFQYTIPSVSLPRQKSAMLPIVTDPIDAQPVSIFNMSVLPTHPLNGAILKNTTNKHLLAGPITVFAADAYAGDARIDTLPPGQQRLLSYGIDLDTLVRRNDSSDLHITSAKIVKGALEITTRQVSSEEYVADNKSDKDKTLIIEQPIIPNWKLIEPENPMEKTDTVYRLSVPAPANKQAKLTVRQANIESQSVAILPCDIGTLLVWSQKGEISAKVRDALTKAISLKQAAVDAQREIDQRQERIKEITAEQGRLRENMKAVDRKTEYYNRLMTKLNDQESQLETLHTETEAQRKTLKDRTEELEKYLSETEIG